MDINARIAQFETMVRPGADPDNDMAWFSLGQAYAQASRHADAANAFVRCFTINPDMSKARQLAGEQLVKAGEKDKAVQVLTEGVKASASRGDRLPQKAMTDLLTTLGAPVPKVDPDRPSPGPAGGITDARTGRPGTKLPRPPFKGPVGQWIFENVTKEAFDSWIKQGTKVINELRLDLSREQDAETYDKHMREHLGIDDELYAKLTGKN